MSPPPVKQLIAKVSPDRLKNPPQSSEDLKPFKFGNLAPTIPDEWVDGNAYGRIAQDPGSDNPEAAPPSVTIDVNESFVIDVYWDVSGPFVSAFSGNWAVTIFFDCEMDPDKDLKIEAKNDIPFGCPSKGARPPYGSSRQYHASFLVKPRTVEVLPDKKGTPYELSISIVLLDTCNNAPTTGLVGFVDLGAVLFYSLDDEEDD
jgi:hypothetical protein